MKNIKILLLLCFAITFCSFNATDWIVFLSHDGKFKISFPREPEVLKHVVDTGIIPVKSRLVKYDVGKFKDDNQSYQLIYSDYVDSIISSDFKLRITDTFLKNIIFTIKDEIKGRIISIENIEYKTYPGRHVHYTFNGKYVLNMKMYLIKSRLYLIKVECEITNDNNASMEKFFDSFETLENQSKNVPKKSKNKAVRS